MAQSPASPSAPSAVQKLPSVHYGPSTKQRFSLQDLYLVPRLHEDGSQASSSGDVLSLVVASPYGGKGVNSRIKMHPSKVQCTTCQKFEVLWDQDSARFECQGCTTCPRCGSNNILLGDRKSRDKYRLSCTNCGFATTNMDLGGLQDHIRDSQLHADPTLHLTESLFALQQGIKKRESASISKRVLDLRKGKDDDALYKYQEELFQREQKRAANQKDEEDADDENMDDDDLPIANMTFSASSQAIRQFQLAHELATKELLSAPRPGKLPHAPLLAEVAKGAFKGPVSAPFPVPDAATCTSKNRQVHHRDPSTCTKAMMAQGSGITLNKVCANRGMIATSSSSTVSSSDAADDTKPASPKDVIPYKLLRSYPRIEDSATQMPLYTPSSVVNLSGDMSSASVERLVQDTTANPSIGTWLNATRHILSLKPMLDWRKTKTEGEGAMSQYFVLSSPAPETRVELSRFKIRSVKKGYTVTSSLNVDGVGLGETPIVFGPRPHNFVVQEFVDDAIAAAIASSATGAVMEKNKLFFKCDVNGVPGAAGGSPAWIAELGLHEKIHGRSTNITYFVFVA